MEEYQCRAIDGNAAHTHYVFFPSNFVREVEVRTITIITTEKKNKNCFNYTEIFPALETRFSLTSR